MNKNVEERKNMLQRKSKPRRDSVENISFWTRNAKRKVFNTTNEQQ